MKKILCYIDKTTEKAVSLPFPCDKSTKLKDAYEKDHSVIIFSQGFLKKQKKLNLEKLNGKVCLIYFAKNSKNNLKVLKKFKLFDYISGGDSSEEVTFKLRKAYQFLKLKRESGMFKKGLSERDKAITEMSLTDPLTKCYNWRYFLKVIPQELNRARRQLYKVAFICVDIDNFQRINEVYGANVADEILREVADIIKQGLRRDDILIRWRVDEFFIIAPYSGDKGAENVAERIRKAILQKKFKYKKLTIALKASLGVVCFDQNYISNSRDIVGALHVCIMQAKRKGGNVVVAYSPKKHKKVTKQTKKANIHELRGQIEKMNVLVTRDLLDMIYGFARAIEVKDSYTGKHVESTAKIAEEIAKTFKLPKNEIENIKSSAILHDLGKVGIDQRILLKKGALTAKEREIIKSHPSIGTEILREIHALRGSIPGILYHHERYDGGGYPLGLRENEIPLSARIVAIADVYQALISDRPYRKAYSRKKALSMIKKESGKQFDPKVVKVFLKIIDKINGKA